MVERTRRCVVLGDLEKDGLPRRRRDGEQPRQQDAADAAAPRRLANADAENLALPNDRQGEEKAARLGARLVDRDDAERARHRQDLFHRRGVPRIVREAFAVQGREQLAVREADAAQPDHRGAAPCGIGSVTSGARR